MNQWAQARVDADVAFLERFYGAELRLNQMNGGVASRAEDIAAFANGMIKPEYIRDTELAVNVYGDTALVTGVESLKGVAFGVPGEMSLRVTNVLVHRDGRWQLVHHQSTAVSLR
jgi:ketosteroid isomerase-like protein